MVNSSLRESRALAQSLKDAFKKNDVLNKDVEFKRKRCVDALYFTIAEKERLIKNFARAVCGSNN